MDRLASGPHNSDEIHRQPESPQRMIVTDQVAHRVETWTKELHEINFGAQSQFGRNKKIHEEFVTRVKIAYDER